MVKKETINHQTESKEHDEKDFIYVPSLELYVAKEKTHFRKNWFESHKLLQEQGNRMLIIPEFIEFLKYLKSRSNNQEYQNIYKNITGGKNYWIAEWLDAVVKNMFGGIDPKKMQSMMKQMGISQVEIPSEKVIIEKTDGSKIFVENPSVMRIKMQGQESFQISGEIREETAKVEISEDDINAVVEKTGVSKKKARETLEKTGDLAEAILELSE